jgi:hypothetical protein
MVTMLPKSRCQPHRQVIVPIEQPGVPRPGREQCQRANRREARIVFGGAALDVTDLAGETEILRIDVGACPARV